MAGIGYFQFQGNNIGLCLFEITEHVHIHNQPRRWSISSPERMRIYGQRDRNTSCILGSDQKECSLLERDWEVIKILKNWLNKKEFS